MISFDWLILIFFLIALSYAAWVIKNEKKVFLKNPISYQIGPFLLQIPHWWSLKENREDQIIFERKDTTYDWICTFSLIKNSPVTFDKFLENFVKNKKIIFDPENSDFNFKSNLESLEMIETGGSATFDEIERIYYEIAMVKYQNLFLICESRSSILNGAIEGPYFEEVINRIKPA